ncbi:polyphosphate kinase 1 [Calycomorphotria hydatis]|uniref:Polyphosphate kinase n=1 Tax=Calycomorphotria hydatis TaxID=2528027 RepID=A0A517T528_9PLAN|nr:polyphosphate kinase 1 [Calycomorphotria hydatis]QDT63474.1 Polyphosphate kinase [Calycomorphotria hydatis]
MSTTDTPEIKIGSESFINRELSWLEFNQRVLDEASNTEVPLLERLKFLAITASNLNEFFMVRVGGLQQLARRGSTRVDPAGMTAAEQVDAIRSRVKEMVAEQYQLFEELRRALSKIGLRQLAADKADDRQREVMTDIFSDEVFGVFTPMSVVATEPFPQLTNGTLHLCVRLQGVQESDSEEPPADRFAIIPFGPVAPRFVTVPAKRGYSYILLEDLATTFINQFFPGETILEATPFRVSLDADLSVREDAASDLLEEMRGVLEARKEGHCVRLEIGAHASEELVQFLVDGLEVEREDVYQVSGPVDLSAFFAVADQRGFDKHRYKRWRPQESVEVDPAKPMFETIAEKDLMLYHPFESFEPVVRFIEEAADDRDVLAIKQTLYRTSRNSPIVAALARAAERGKAVTAIVELKARFDEKRNIEWAEELERSGVQVLYGVRGLKTHAKVCIVVRREPEGIRRYAHFSTGNYNENTAKLYGDVSLLTCDEDLTADAISFFNAVTGYSQPQKFRKLDAAPLGLRNSVEELIEGEILRAQQGAPAWFRAKLNSIVCPSLIAKMYEASQAGVKIELNVRGICCLRPGVEGLSENIRVISIIDRFLEHARIMEFCHDGDPRVYISSADWMPRNLDRRVELIVPVEDQRLQARLSHILDVCFTDNVKAREILPDGSYRLLTHAVGEEAIRSQQVMYDEAVEAVREQQEQKPTMFEPYRADDRE